MNPTKPKRPEVERTVLAHSLIISRIITGLWQRADSSAGNANMETAVDVMDKTIRHGLDTFDMADHYGDAELVVGQHNELKPDAPAKVSMTKWCPQENGVKSFENASEAVELSLRRMGQQKIDLLQYHIWDYSDDTYLHNLKHLCTLQEHGKIGLIGLTNTDTGHLELLLDSGYPIATNQVAVNVLDRRLTRGMMHSICLNRGVGILAYGVLLGGFLSEKWLRQPEPSDISLLDASRRKYLRFIWAAGGWAAFQVVLEALDTIAHAHGLTIAAVATKYVLDIPSVSAVIIGSRLSVHSPEYIEKTTEAFTLRLTKDDMALIKKAQEGLEDLPGDCGDEYRRPPFLTAAGDRSDHLKEVDRIQQISEALSLGKRIEYFSGDGWWSGETGNDKTCGIKGQCQAIRTGTTIRVSGTTAATLLGVLGGTSVRSQTLYIMDMIEGALKALGSSLSDVIRTRIMFRDEIVYGLIKKVHDPYFVIAGVCPASTYTITSLIGNGVLVEIEAEAEVGSGKNGVLRIMT